MGLQPHGDAEDLIAPLLLCDLEDGVPHPPVAARGQGSGIALRAELFGSEISSVRLPVRGRGLQAAEMANWQLLARFRKTTPSELASQVVLIHALGCLSTAGASSALGSLVSHYAGYCPGGLGRRRVAVDRLSQHGHRCAPFGVVRRRDRLGSLSWWTAPNGLTTFGDGVRGGEHLVPWICRRPSCCKDRPRKPP